MESTLSLTKTQYKQKLGLNMGVGLGLGTAEEPTWSARSEYIINDCAESGLRRFYHCGYKWSFLKPYKTLTLKEGESYLDMPDDFGGLEGNIIISQDGSGYGTVKLKNTEVIERFHNASPTLEGPPTVAALYARKAPADDKDQKFRLRFFPLADEEYTIRFQYYVNPDFFDGTNERAYGGPAHVETILASIMAIKEERYDNMMNGPMSQKFMQLLQASFVIDARFKEQFVGENADNSDEMLPRVRNFPTLLINGVDPSL